MRSRIFFITGILSINVVSVSAQQALPPPYTNNLPANRVRVWEPKKPLNLESDVIAPSAVPQSVTQTSSYYDGYDRPIQIVIMQGTFGLKDAVSVRTYNAIGREQYNYLPFPSTSAQAGDNVNDGNLKIDPTQQEAAFYNTQFPDQLNESYQGPSYLPWAYSKANFENSPLNRVTENYPPGVNWVGSEGSANHNVKRSYLVNSSTDNVRTWNILPAQGSIPTSSGSYAAGTLYKNIKTDEQSHQTIEFTDLYGQVILRKQQLSAANDNGSGSGHTGWLCTYFVYDDYGNKRFIISPDAVVLINNVWTITQQVADELCYRMEYDAQNRMIINKNPGAAEIWMVYDKLNRLVLKQDGNLRNTHQWNYMQYDILDRPSITGIWTDANYNNLAYQIQQASTSSTYPNLSGQTITVITRTFYDDYSQVASCNGMSNGTRLATFDSYLLPASNNWPYPQQSVQSSQTRGLVTGRWVNLLSTIYGLGTIYFYDQNARIIQTQTNNIAGQQNVITRQYSFNGLPLIDVNQSAVGSGNLLVTKREYDYNNRLTKTTTNMGSGSPDQQVEALTYDELGRLKTRILGSNMESQTFDYNVRSWLIGNNRNYIGNSSTNYFAYELGYDKPAAAAVGAGFINIAFNGNNAGTIWRSAGDGVNRKFDYYYDNQNRLTSAPYLQNTTGTVWDKTIVDFSVNSMGYDGNGNLSSLSENGFSLGAASPNIDNLTYSFVNGTGNSNRLQNVSDGSNNASSILADFHYPAAKPVGNIDYAYDYNGNITSDYNRDISTITYNYLNFPSALTTSKGTVQYITDAAGNKIEKIVTENAAGGKQIVTTTLYNNGFVYKWQVTSPTADPTDYPLTLQFINHPQGRIRYIVLPTPHYVYDYFLKDNLDNTRMILTDEVQQDIYPAATLENDTYNGNQALTYESSFYSINTGDVIATSTLPSWFTAIPGSSYQNQNNSGSPANNDIYSNLTATSTKVYKLNGQVGDKYGLGITLKVMAGDKISIFAKSFWHNSGQTVSSYPITNVLASFLAAFAGTTAVATSSHNLVTGPLLNSTPATTAPLTTLLTNTPNQGSPTTQPKAAINWILFDDQFRPVSVGTDLVSGTGDLIKNHSILNTVMAKNGFLYVYCSDESNLDVYFDNLQLVDTRGPILEETHYYPTGLAMAGISDKAWNKLPSNFHFQGKELQSQEFKDGSGLEQHDFHARFYDQQLGVWHNQDPANQFSSPYLAMGNSWPNGVDKDGKSWFGDIFRVINGIFAWNDHRTFGGNLWAIFSRSTFESAQQMGGTLIALGGTVSGRVKSVEYFDGALVVRSNQLSNYEAFTLGNTIIGDDDHLNTNIHNPLLQHEYGRVLQSRAQGMTYFGRTALPSLFDNTGNANSDIYAQDGNARALEYFYTNYGGQAFANTWNFRVIDNGNPIDNYCQTCNFEDPINQKAIKDAKRGPF